MTPDPLIPAEHVEKICRPGQPGCCAFLASRQPPEYFCAKAAPDLLRAIQSRLAEGTMGAQGDNCSGPPDYKIRRIWKTGESLRIVFQDSTVEGYVVLASTNGRSLMLGFETILGGYAGMMPVLEEQGVFRDLITRSTVTLLDHEDRAP